MDREELKSIIHELPEEKRREIAVKLGEAALEGKLGPQAFEFLEEMAGMLLDKDPKLAKAEAFMLVMATEIGQAVYKAYDWGIKNHHGRKKRVTVEKDEEPIDDTMGPVEKEVCQKADRMIEKSAEPLKKGDAIVKVLNADPALYRRYIKEVTISTAVG